MRGCFPEVNETCMHSPKDNLIGNIGFHEMTGKYCSTMLSVSRQDSMLSDFYSTRTMNKSQKSND